MSTELAVAQERGQSMAELMGVSASSGEATPSIARIGMLHSPLKGEIEVNGKMIKTDVVSVGAFILTRGEEKVYSDGITVRIFAQRHQLTRWNSEKNEMEKTVLSNVKSGDWKDSVGGFNLGTPNRYFTQEEYGSLTDAQKDAIKTGGTGYKVNRVIVMYGTVSLDNPVNEKGEALDYETYRDIPFVMDVKNSESKSSINRVLGVLKRKNMLPIMSTIKLVGVEGSIPTGATFGKIEASMGSKVDIVEGDNEMLKDFIELIEYSNGKILDLHHERAKAHTDEDEGLVQEILNNDFVDVDVD